MSSVIHSLWRAGTARSLPKRGVEVPVRLMLLALVFWPVWQWYVVTLCDPAEDASVLVALGTAIIFFFTKPPAQSRPAPGWRVPALFLLGYTLLYHWLPPFTRALIAVVTLGYYLSHWRFGNQKQPWLYGLLALSLPVLSPLLFYVSYPLRLLVGECARLLLNRFGFSVVFEGLVFQWNEHHVWLDELCSGVRKLWAGLYFSLSLAAFYDLAAMQTLLVIGFGTVAFIVANVLRVSLLFYVKVGLFTPPEWFHQTSGILMFLLAALITLALTQIARKYSRPIAPIPVSSSDVHTTTQPFPKTSVKSRSLFLFLCVAACVIPFVPVTFTSHVAENAFPGWPDTFDGQPLHQLEALSLPARYEVETSGRIAYFTDGEREIIMRWIPEVSRSVRSSWDALQGSGHQFSQGILVWRDEQGTRWRSFDVDTSSRKFRVLERIYDTNGRSWLDVSSWYWAVVLRQSRGPWWIVTTFEKVQPESTQKGGA